jgi:hypothetical protein
MNYLLIPGNPPAVHFYEEWKNEIELSQKDFLTRVSSYGQLTKNNSISSKLDEMITHHHEQLENFIEIKGENSTILRNNPSSCTPQLRTMNTLRGII